MCRPSLRLCVLFVLSLAACVGQIGLPAGGSAADEPGPSDAATSSDEPFVPALFRSDASVPVPDASAVDFPPDAGSSSIPADASSPDVGPAACPSLASRVTVSSIDVSPLQVATGYAGGWSANRPVLLAPLPDGSARVAWTDDAGKAHVTAVKADGTRAAADVTLAADSVRGFVAHADGHNALMVVRGDSMYLVRLDGSGTAEFETRIVGGGSQTQDGSKWVDGWGHEGRLVFQGGNYAVYMGHTMYWNATVGKHQGDLLRLYDTKGMQAGGFWDWGCSHSLDLRLVGNGTDLFPVCLSDCYPEKAILLNHYTKLRDEPSGGCNGYTNATLGGLVAGTSGGFVTFTSREGRASSDVGLIAFDGNGKTTTSWLTDTASANEDSAHLGRYGGDLLAGWTDSGKSFISVVREDGTVADGPVEISAQWGVRDDFQTYPNGDVGWAYSWGDGHLKVVRVRNCR